MADAGLDVLEDGAGNIRGRWHGTDPLRGGVATGSHADAIPNSGKFDGVVGVLGAIAALKALKSVGYVPVRSLEAVMFAAEEPTRFGLSCLGSRAMAGWLSAPELSSLKDENGTSFLEAAVEAGYGFGPALRGGGPGAGGGDARLKVSPDPPPAAAPAAVLASSRIPLGVITHFLELHIEQAPRLDEAGEALGVVTAIAAPTLLRLTLSGPGGHAGTVPMARRSDPAATAADIALAAEAAARATGSPDSVATVGSLTLSPGAANAVPSSAVLTVDVRDTDAARRDGMVRAIRAAAASAAKSRGVGLTIDTLSSDPPLACHPEIVAAAARGVAAVTPPRLGSGSGSGRDLNASIAAVPRLVSGAYHDALVMGRSVRAGMIFVRCEGGRSHVPEESAAAGDVARGAAALALALADLGAGTPPVGRAAPAIAAARGATGKACPITGRVDDGGGSKCPFAARAGAA
jgi:ureidoglycolate amidohydrolase